MSGFRPGDRVRFIRGNPAIGTVIHDDRGEFGLTDVEFDDPTYPRPLVVQATDLRLAGTRCLPPEEMSPQQMRDHLRIAHRWPAGATAQRSQGDSEDARLHLLSLHSLAEQAAMLRRTFGASGWGDAFPPPVPHTHRKAPAP